MAVKTRLRPIAQKVVVETLKNKTNPSVVLRLRWHPQHDAWGKYELQWSVAGLVRNGDDRYVEVPEIKETCEEGEDVLSIVADILKRLRSEGREAVLQEEEEA